MGRNALRGAVVGNLPYDAGEDQTTYRLVGVPVHTFNESPLHSQEMPPPQTPTAQNFTSGTSCHTCTKTMYTCASANFRLISPLGCHLLCLASNYEFARYKYTHSPCGRSTQRLQTARCFKYNPNLNFNVLQTLHYTTDLGEKLGGVLR